jgi:hypothetical protein
MSEAQTTRPTHKVAVPAAHANGPKASPPLSGAAGIGDSRPARPLVEHANSGKLVAAQPRLGADVALAADPPPDRRRARSGSKSGDVVVVASAVDMTPDEAEAMAQRLAALLLRAP